MQHRSPLVVHDVRRDARFKKTPAASTALRFYAGAPLLTGTGDVLGTLCIVHTAPQSPSAHAAEPLEDVAALLADALQMRLERNDVQKEYAALAQEANDALFRYDVVHGDSQMRFRLAFSNAALHEVTGRPAAEMQGRFLSDVHALPSAAQIRHACMRCVRTGETVECNVDASVPTPNSTWAVTLTPIAVGGTVQRIMGIARHVPERSETTRHLRRSRDLLAQTQRVAGAYEVDVATGAVSWTDKVYAIHDLPPNTPMDLDTGLGFYAAEAQDDVRQAMDRCIRTGAPIDLEVPIVTATGERRWIRNTGEAILDATGTVVRIVGAVQDVTERKRAEVRLQDHATQLRGLANSVPGVLFQFYARDIPGGEPEYGLHFVSRHARSVLGIDPSPEGFFERYLERVSPSHQQAFLESVQHAVANKAPWQFEMPFDASDGETVWIQGRAEPEQRSDALIFNGVLLDVSDHKATEASLREARDAAKEANRLKSALLANMSHEVRTPLTAVLGFADLLDEMDLPDQAATFVRRIHESGQRLFETLASVLSLSRLQAGTIDLYPQTFDLRGTVQAALEKVRPKAAAANVVLHLDAPAPVQAYADGSSVRRVLDNLLSNAVKFTKDSGAVFVRCETTEEAAVVTVSDTGVGIGRAFLPHVFTAFKQESQGNAREFGGAGLGLAIASQLVDLMEGSIEVDSTKGEGATFTVRLPRSKAESGSG